MNFLEDETQNVVQLFSHDIRYWDRILINVVGFVW